MSTRHTSIDTPIGELTLVAEDGALSGRVLPRALDEARSGVVRRAPRSTGSNASSTSSPSTSRASAPPSTLPTRLVRRSVPARGVWTPIDRIPYGETTTYGAARGRSSAIHGWPGRVGNAVGEQPALDRHPVPPGRGQGRQAHRLRGRARAKGAPPLPGGPHAPQRAPAEPARDRGSGGTLARRELGVAGPTGRRRRPHPPPSLRVSRADHAPAGEGARRHGESAPSGSRIWAASPRAGASSVPWSRRAASRWSPVQIMRTAEAASRRRPRRSGRAARPRPGGRRRSAPVGERLGHWPAVAGEARAEVARTSRRRGRRRQQLRAAPQPGRRPARVVALPEIEHGVRREPQPGDTGDEARHLRQRHRLRAPLGQVVSGTRRRGAAPPPPPRTASLGRRGRRRRCPRSQRPTPNSTAAARYRALSA